MNFKIVFCLFYQNTHNTNDFYKKISLIVSSHPLLFSKVQGKLRNFTANPPRFFFAKRITECGGLSIKSTVQTNTHYIQLHTSTYYADATARTKTHRKTTKNHTLRAHNTHTHIQACTSRYTHPHINIQIPIKGYKSTHTRTQKIVAAGSNTRAHKDGNRKTCTNALYTAANKLILRRRNRTDINAQKHTKKPYAKIKKYTHTHTYRHVHRYKNPTIGIETPIKIYKSRHIRTQTMVAADSYTHAQKGRKQKNIHYSLSIKNLFYSQFNLKAYSFNFILNYRFEIQKLSKVNDQYLKTLKHGLFCRIYNHTPPYM